MKHYLICIFFLLTSVVFSQNEKDSIPVENVYIKDYTNQLNVKFEISNEVPAYKVPFEGSSVKIEPNLGLRYAFVFNYKFASLRLGIRPNKANNDEKGDPKTFRLKFKLIFDRWSHHFEYNQVKGYYISDEDFIQNYTNNHFIFPDLKTKVFTGTTAYKVNDDYSIRATVSHTEAQLKSAGSFLPSFTYSIYGMNGLDNYLNEDGDPIERDSFTDNNGFTGILSLGYHYTFVYKKWYTVISATPGIGYDFRKVSEYNSGVKTNSSHNAFLTSFSAGAGIGYNSEKIFFGANYNHNIVDYKHSEERVEFLTTKHSFFIFLGYRFKAPKVVSKSINKIEETIPVLKQD